jgi:hypothetical protein
MIATAATQLATNLEPHVNLATRLPKKITVGHTAILDSGTTGHYLLLTAPCHNKQPVTHPLQVKLPNGHTIDSTHTCELNLPGLPLQARKAHLFPALAGHSLLSVGQLCDQGWDVTFVTNSVLVTHNKRTLLTGHRDTNGLWAVPLPEPTYSANAVAFNVPASANLRELIQYLHACCFSPSEATWIYAIRNGHFATWPALTVEAVNKFLPPTSTATPLGHLNQKRKNLHSTQPKATMNHKPLLAPLDVDNIVSSPLSNGIRTNAIYAATETVSTVTDSIGSDQTGQFPVTSTTSMKYVIVVYDYDSNAILAEPLLNRGAKTIFAAFQKSIPCSSPEAYAPNSNA